VCSCSLTSDVELAQNKWQDIYSGIIEENGISNTPLAGELPDGDYSMIIYSPAIILHIPEATWKLADVASSG
jgi:flavoprotein